MSKEYTAEEVAPHSTKKDLWLIIHGNVYDSSAFCDEHPGGEEVLLDVGGQDASEAFEDVGHSDEAREILEGLLVGKLKGGAVQPKTATTDKVNAGPKPAGGEQSTGMMLYAIILLGGLLAYAAYIYLGQQSK